MSLAIIIDLIIVAIIALCTFIGYKQGLIKVAVKLVATIVAIILALILYKPISTLIINNTGIDEQIQTSITNKLIPENSSKAEKSVINTESLPDLIVSHSENTVNSISEVISIKLIELVVIVILYVAIKIVLRFITLLADLIAKLPVLNQINKLGGTIYGVLKGLILVFAIFAIISLAAPLIGENFMENINQSYIGSFMYNNNLLLKIIL